MRSRIWFGVSACNNPSGISETADAFIPAIVPLGIVRFSPETCPSTRAWAVSSSTMPLAAEPSFNVTT